jgi:hypothetical protein
MVAAMQARSAARAIALARAVFGAVLTLRTASMLRALVRDAEPTGSLFLFARTVGIRDLVLGAGTLVASFGEEEDLRPWVSASFASDALDLVSGMASASQVGASGSVAATAASIPFVAGGWWTLRRLSGGPFPASRPPRTSS